ncbi:PIR protein [Plasmodium yoelii]|uniref:PIR protein n=2 Tax=Plasmodium yoelii TaxID=5861 RepID=A0AAF0B5P1_PLAYO|nr:PIR protein [Plasmodium yoelii]WBY60538.1 PIR protein [Plasmodium yoelii yoelii]CDU20355.1 YIR protein [Plasmodium yoelii]VTZ81315.1 PIR protein [Plasmodium yoelii]|eukprot:XP_022810781.1 PIR protein [Plasmodium yoelii]
MDKEVCGRFKNVWTNFTYDSSDKSYKFTNNNSNTFCGNNSCDSNIEKINAVCLYLFNQFFGDSSSPKKHNNINIVEYIMIWLSYMLNLIENNDNNISNLKHFYDTNIKNDKYTKSIVKVEGCKNYKELIDKTNLMSMDIKDISKFYEAFKSLCEMYTEFNESTSNCTNISQKAKEFVTKYDNLSENSGVTSNSPYNKLLCTLSSDFNNLKNKCNDSSSFPTIDKTKSTIKCPEEISDATSSSSTANKLFIVLSIFGAIAIFLGISYKYSLFGFRKRFQKQKLKEKIKNIKKRMNH